MEPFRDVHGTAVPITRPDIDTDQIIPRDFLITRSRQGLGRGFLYNWRHKDGAEVEDFPLNRPEYKGATVLIGGPNFACGSSREHAVWAIMDYGIRAVIAPSYGVHFSRNSYKNGLLPVVLPADQTDMIVEAVESSRGERKVSVSLTDCLVTVDGGPTFPFEIDDDARTALMEGLDDIGLTLKHRAAIDRFQSTDRNDRPWVYLDNV